MHPQVNNQGNDDEIHGDVDEVAPHDGCGTDVEARQRQSLHLTERQTQQRIDDVSYERRYQFRDRTAENEPDRQTDDALFSDKFRESPEHIALLTVY